MKRTTNNLSIYIGIDPGNASGGMAWIGSTKPHPLDTMRFMDETSKDLCTLLGTFPYAVKNVFVILEEVHPFPAQGVVAAGKMMENYGMLKGFLMALDIPFKTVRPQVWQKYYSMHRDKNETVSKWKQRLRQRAQELFPSVKITAETADAILIANYCMYNY